MQAHVITRSNAIPFGCLDAGEVRAEIGVVFFLDGKPEDSSGQERASPAQTDAPCLCWEGRQSVSGSVSLHDPPRRSQLFTNTCLLLGGAVSWNLAMALGLGLISGGIAWERRAQFL